MSTKFELSSDAIHKIEAFQKAEDDFRTAWGAFAEIYSVQLAGLEKLREERNAKLDDARRVLRAEVTIADITKIKSVHQTPFTVMKKWSHFYIPEKLMARLEAKGLLDSAMAAKIIAQKIEVEKFDIVHQFLKEQELDKDFEDCEDGVELTPAITGPKPIPPFGAELKESK